jgi:alkylated DNA repair dioxygenase AlkB
VQLDLFNSDILYSSDPNIGKQADPNATDSAAMKAAMKNECVSQQSESYFEHQFILHRSWLPKSLADPLFKDLLNTISWQEEWISMYGKQVLCPRLTYWMGDCQARYVYSNISHNPNPWHGEVERLKTIIEQQCKSSLNSCLLNLYRNQLDSVSWHQDNEPELGEEPFIASLSLGESRIFEIKNIASKKKFQLNLHHGDLLIMQKSSQSNWLHQLPKSQFDCNPRVNLTFRMIRS